MSSTPAAHRSASTTVGRYVQSLREAPATLPALAAMALFVVWATNQAGYPLTHWAPGGLIVLALLGIALCFVGLRLAEIPTGGEARARLPGGIHGAELRLDPVGGRSGRRLGRGQPDAAVPARVRAVRALAPAGRSAALLLGVWTVAMIGLAVFVALHVNAAAHSSARLEALLPGGRLVYPAGYVNASAAQWLMAFWPALLLAREARLHWSLRGLLAGGAVLLAEVALLSVSRGALYATPVMLVLVFALLPGRARTFALLVPVAAGIGAAVPSVLRVGERIEHGQPAASAVHAATAATFIAALAVGLLVALGAAIESRSRLSEASAEARAPGRRRGRARHARRGARGRLDRRGQPGHARAPRLGHVQERQWLRREQRREQSSDRAGSGATATTSTGWRWTNSSRIRSSGSARTTSSEQYLVHGRSDETPHYPHSVELRTLTETGLVGALLALVGLGAALMAGWRALRGSDPLGRAVAAAALAGFAYWVVHGSFDWFWEFAGLGAPAFAMLGLACALAPRRVAPRRRWLTGGQGSSVPCGTLALAHIERSGAWASSPARSWRWPPPRR